MQNFVLEQNFTPEETVKKFIEADMAGARLGGEINLIKKTEINNYIEFISEEELIMIIDKYEIIDKYPSQSNNKYYVKTKYYCKYGIEPVGIYDEKNEYLIGFKNISCADFFKEMCPACFEETNESSAISFDVKNNLETVLFELTKKENTWTISYPSIYPHISESTLRKHIELLNKK